MLNKTQLKLAAGNYLKTCGLAQDADTYGVEPFILENSIVQEWEKSFNVLLHMIRRLYCIPSAQVGQVVHHC